MRTVYTGVIGEDGREITRVEPSGSDRPPSPPPLVAIAPDDMYARIAALRPATHTHVIGGSRSGKSKFIEWLIRNDIANGRPFCVIDWHGTLYQDLLRYLAYRQPRREFILLNPAYPEWITGFNPFAGSDEDAAAAVGRSVAAVARAWGVAHTNDMPNYERLASMVFHFAAVTGETLPNAALLLRRHKKELRRYAVKVTKDAHMREEWWDLIEAAKRPRDWHMEVLAVRNRFMRFLRYPGIRRFMGLKGGLDIQQAMEGGKNILVNLADTRALDRQSAALFAALLINSFLEAAMARAGTKKLFVLYLDEFQEYISPDLAAMLDQVLKGGLHLALIHHHLAQLQQDARLRKSITQNAGMRFVFKMRDFEDAAFLANQALLDRINARQIKETYYKTTTYYSPESFETITAHENGTSVTTGTRYSPWQMREKQSDAEWTRDEKVSHGAETFMGQVQRECHAQLDTVSSFRWEVPLMPAFYISPDRIASYERRLCEKQGARSAAEVDAALEESEKRFTSMANRSIRETPKEEPPFDGDEPPLPKLTKRRQMVR